MRSDPPTGLEVEVKHDGVVAEVGGASDLRIAAGLVVVVAGGSGLLAGALDHRLWIVGGFVVLLALVPLLVRSTGWRFEITDRWVQVDRVGWRTTRWRFPLDELERWWVAEPREDYGGWSLVLRGTHETVRVAEGQPREQLEWIRAAIDEAVETRRRREAVEGREWGFQKKAPQAIQSLVERE